LVSYTDGILQHGEITRDQETGRMIIGEAAGQSVAAIKDKPAEFKKCWQCSGNGVCPWCKEEGLRRFGNGPIGYEDQRR
jgi:hypothetical protein